jgi:hypothetical protein
MNETDLELRSKSPTVDDDRTSQTRIHAVEALVPRHALEPLYRTLDRLARDRPHLVPLLPRSSGR